MIQYIPRKMQDGLDTYHLEGLGPKLCPFYLGKVYCIKFYWEESQMCHLSPTFVCGDVFFFFDKVLVKYFEFLTELIKGKSKTCKNIIIFLMTHFFKFKLLQD